MKPLGACHGFEIRSDLAFQTLRGGSGLPIRVDERGDREPMGDLLAEWHPRHNNPFHGRLLTAEGRYSFWASDAGWYEIDPIDRVIRLPLGPATLRRELRMLGIPTGLCVLESGGLPVHAAAVEIDGRAVLLAGPGHHGKTTLAAGFARAGYRFLSEDTTCCRPGVPPQVYPGPAVLRLRRDVADHLEDSNVVRVRAEDSPDRAHFLFRDDVRGSGDPLPLAAIVLLKVGTGAPQLRQVASGRAIPDLWAVTFHLPTDRSRASCFEKLAALVTQTEVLELERPLTLEGLGGVIDLVVSHVRGG